MTQYEVVKSPGIQFPVGHVFESDALHPSMAQFVKLLRGKKVRLQESDEDDNGPGPEDLIGEDYVDDPDKAFDLATAEQKKRDKPKPAPTTKPERVKPVDGPGENS